MSTLGHPGRYTYCIGEHEEVSPWEPLHVERGFAREESTVTFSDLQLTLNPLIIPLATSMSFRSL